MAIEKTYFTSTTAYASMAEIYEYLAANATDYFDTIEQTTDDSGNVTNISCKVGTQEVLLLTVSGSYIYIKSTLVNGTQVSYNGLYVVYFAFVKKTSTGLLLSGIVRNTSFVSVWITKSNNDDTMIIVGDNSYNYVQFIDSGVSTALKSVTFSNSTLPILSSYTALCPICTEYGSYSPNAFLVVFTQLEKRYEADADITANGTEYAVRGAVCLKA